MSAGSSEPFKNYTSDEKDELFQAEQAASSSWQKWHDAKQQLSKDASDDDKASVDRLQEEAERKQADLKALQNLC